jgi:hypothetical protein
MSGAETGPVKTMHMVFVDRQVHFFLYFFLRLPFCYTAVKDVAHSLYFSCLCEKDELYVRSYAIVPYPIIGDLADVLHIGSTYEHSRFGLVLPNTILRSIHSFFGTQKFYSFLAHLEIESVNLSYV